MSNTSSLEKPYNIAVSQSCLNELRNTQTEVLLRKLAIYYNKTTQLVAVPQGTTRWRFVIAAVYPGGEPETRYIELIPFFGMYLGFDETVNVLVGWQ